MNFKIRISHHIAKSDIEQQSINQIRHCLAGQIQIWHHFLFDQKISLKYFTMTFKIEISRFYD